MKLNDEQLAEIEIAMNAYIHRRLLVNGVLQIPVGDLLDTIADLKRLRAERDTWPRVSERLEHEKQLARFHELLAIVGALRGVATHFETDHIPDVSTHKQVADYIRSCIPSADSDALDAYVQQRVDEAEKRGWDKCAEDEDRQINVECEKAIHAELDALGVPQCGGSIVRLRWLAAHRSKRASHE